MSIPLSRHPRPSIFPAKPATGRRGGRPGGRSLSRAVSLGHRVPRRSSSTAVKSQPQVVRPVNALELVIGAPHRGAGHE